MSQETIKFAYWVPNVSGGLVVSKIVQRTSWDIDYNQQAGATGRAERLRLRAQPDPLYRGLRRRIPA
jgi:hypothetical protein